MPEPGMGANNDHSPSSAGSMGGGGDNNNTGGASSDNTTADNISSSNTTADNLSQSASDSDNDKPTTAESLARSPTTADSLSSTPTHSYDEVPAVAVSRPTPPDSSRSTDSDTDTRTVTNSSVSTADLPAGITRENADLFGISVHPVGGVDAVWDNGDGTFSSSDGTTYNTRTGEGTYDPGEDSFAVTSRANVTVVQANVTSEGVTFETEQIETLTRERHPDRVMASESLALAEHDPKGLTRAYGARTAFDYYNNPNMAGIRDEALMHASNRAGHEVAGRYPGENLAYMSVAPIAHHLARSYGLTSPSNNINSSPPYVTVYRVDTGGFPARITNDGTIPVVTTRAGTERTLFININQPNRARDFATQNRNGDATITAVEADPALLQTLRSQSVYDRSNAASANPDAPLVVDINRAPNQFGLRTPEQIQMLRDRIYPSTTRVVDPNDM